MILKIASDSSVPDVAGAIAGQLRVVKIVQLQAIGAHAVNQMVKAVALAETYLALEGKAVAVRVRMVEVEVRPGLMRDAVRMLAWAAKMPESERAA